MLKKLVITQAVFFVDTFKVVLHRVDKKLRESTSMKSAPLTQCLLSSLFTKVIGPTKSKTKEEGSDALMMILEALSPIM